MSKRKKRRGSGLIIRLIDVVFILLFGFIAISEVSKRSKIKLAKSVAVPASAPDRETVVYIGVLADGNYLVNDESQVITDLGLLEKYILRERVRLSRQNVLMRVRIRTSYNAPVKYAFAVVNICQDMKIPAGLDVIKISQK